MKLEITQHAREKLSSVKALSDQTVLFISHETEGTGCVVNGVSELIVTEQSQLPEEAAFISCEGYQAAIDQRMEWIYEEQLTLEFNESSQMFQLKTPNQMLNPRMKMRMEQKT